MVSPLLMLLGGYPTSHKQALELGQQNNGWGWQCYWQKKYRSQENLSMSSAYSQHVLCILSACPLHTLSMSSAYSQHVLCILSACPLHTLSMSSAYSQHVLCILSACPLHTGWALNLMVTYFTPYHCLNLKFHLKTVRQ